MNTKNKYKKRVCGFNVFLELSNLWKNILLCVSKEKRPCTFVLCRTSWCRRSRTSPVPVTFAILVSTMSSSQWVCVCAGGSPPAAGRHINLPGEGVQVEPWPGQTCLLPQNNATSVSAPVELCVWTYTFPLLLCVKRNWGVFNFRLEHTIESTDGKMFTV